MFKSIFTNSFGILSSRILGFVRDMLTASILGANIFSDIFFVAFKLPNLFRRIFAEGAFSQTFIPAFTRSVHKATFAIKILLSFSIFILVMTLFVELFSQEATLLIAIGFSQEVRALAAPYVGINFIYLILIFWVTFITALLHYKNHFATSAFSTSLLNLALIAALLLAKGEAPQIIVTFLSWGVVVGGILQLVLHLVAAKRYGLSKLLLGGIKHFKHKEKNVKAESKRFKSNFFPAIWGNSTAQVSAFLDTWLASFLVVGSISYLYYANRVFQLPLALFAIATSVALFPKVARAIKNRDETKALNQLRTAFWFLLPILALATIGGVLLSQEIVWLLFERGAFTTQDRVTTASVLIMYMLGLLPFGLSKLFMLWIYAHERQGQAAKIATFSLLTNIILSLALIVPLQAQGLALASTASGFVYFLLTIKAFGVSRFLAIIRVKYLVYLLVLLLSGSAVILGLKELFNAYL